jgi:16S rRNA processing protein RimM
LSQPDNPVKIGVISSAHGVRGQVKIHVFLDNPESLFSYSPITDMIGKRIFKLKRQGVKDSLVIVSIDGVNDRNEAELLKGTELYGPAKKPEKHEKNRWSYAQLTGMEARLVDGNVYGRVSGVYNFGAGDILEIELSHGGSEMIPFTDDFVGDIQADEGSLVVYPPEYVEGEN